MGPAEDARNTYTMSTDRLVLDLPRAEDAATLYQLVGGEHRAEVTDGLIWDGPDEISETLAFIEQGSVEPFYDFGFHWAIRDRVGALSGDGGAVMGMIGTRPRADPGRGDVGYWLGRPYWGLGIMREALVAVLDLCFGELDQVKIEAEIFTTNDRSIRLVEGLGLRREGTIRSAHLKRGTWVDAHVYGILRQEWLESRPTLVA
jgi:RimJ/RimL family protein N-acetyltransferase